MDYRAFCENAPSDFPIFFQHWYLDAVCDTGQWHAAIVHKKGEIAGVLPYFLKKRFFGRYVSMPLLGRFMGPYLLPAYRNTRTEVQLLKGLLAQIPDGLLAYTQDFHYTAANWLPFYWQGYQQTTRYSYRLDLSSLDAVWKGMTADYRNHKIKKATERVQIKTDVSLSDLYRLDQAGYHRQGLKMPYSYPFLERLHLALQGRGQGMVFAAVDRQNHLVHAAAYLIWDHTSAYYLIAGEDPALRSSGAGILLAWHCIRYAAEVLRVPCFDFLGSMTPGIARVREQFGAIPFPYLRVRKRWYDNIIR